jgi:hypothetical protein
MASLRISLINEARQLAAAADDPTGEAGYHVPPETVARLHSRLRGVEEPARVLQWAWRSQRARFDETGWHREGLAALYLLAALIDLQPGGTATGSDGREEDPRADLLARLPTMAGSGQGS